MQLSHYLLLGLSPDPFVAVNMSDTGEVASGVGGPFPLSLVTVDELWSASQSKLIYNQMVSE